MLKKIKLIIIFILFFFINPHSFAENKILFIDLEYIYLNSNVGKEINKKVKLSSKKINDELYNEVIQEEKMLDDLLTDIESRKPILDESIEFQEPSLQSADGVISKNQTVREVFEEFNKDKEMLNRLKDCA